MSVTSKIPPQAYTRDTLVKAIEWLSVQPPSLRERATSADAIVSHYLQARRQTPSQVEAPIVQESFKTDLRHLADDLKRFEVDHGHSHDHSSPPQIIPDRSSSFEMETTEMSEPTMISRRPLRTEPTFRPARSEVQQSLQPQQQALRPQPEGTNWQVDERSLTIARELQERLNLSSEGEALRMLVSLGADQVRHMLP
jgi:hypothetical protein